MSFALAEAAYGLRVEGVESSGCLALRGAANWPSVRVSHETGPPVSDAAINGHHATFKVLTGSVALDRVQGTICFRGHRRLIPDEVVHPLLWPAAAVFARWSGFETLHAGAFADPARRRAWVVMAASGGGKSSLLAALAAAGYEVLTDDLVVADGGHCFAGPRCIDLKLDAARALGLVGQTRLVRSSQRRRLTLPPADGRWQLGGFLALEWGSATATHRLSPSAGFARLAEHRRVGGLGADHIELLRLAGLPMIVLRRPRRWEALDEAVAVLGGAVRG